MKIYLAGAITYHELNNELYKAMNWRNEVAQKLLDLNADICENKFDWFDPTKFQFLIGKLKTPIHGSGGLSRRQFQFLIGKLKTGGPIYSYRDNSLFQFLIGKLKTHSCSQNCYRFFCFNSS